MLAHHFKIAFINILGLSVGAAASLIIFLYVQKELSYDQFLPGSEQIYRVVEERIYPDHVSEFAMIPGGFSTIFPDEIPEIQQSTRLIGFPNFATNVRVEDKVYTEHYIFSADSNFFEVFPFKLLKGNSAKVLRNPNTIILTESLATKYFGDTDPMGKTVRIFDQDQEVVGVMENVPEHSHMKFDALTPALGVGFLEDPSFYIAGTYTYVKLAPGASIRKIEEKIVPLIEKNAAGQIERNVGVSFKKYIEDGNGYIYTLQPIADIHLTSHRTNEIKPNGDMTTVRILGFISILILVIAGINFVNLATARSTERAKEVGVRKVLGSRKSQLIYQFLSESTLISLIGIVIATAIIQLSLGFFSTMAQQQLEFNLMSNPLILVVLVAIVLVLGVIAGLYPAFYISALRPVQVLKGKFQSSSRGSFLRNGLVTFQFTISIILISSTLVVYDQLHFVQTKDLGFEKENLMSINYNSQDDEARALQNEIAKVPGVASVGGGNALPGGYFYGMQFRLPGTSEIYTPKVTNMDDHFNSALGLRVLEGRLFGPAFNDSLSIVVNETAAKVMGLENTVGTVLLNSADPDNPTAYTIVGVVEDFNYESLHTEITPLFMMSTEGQFNFQSVTAVRLNTSNLSSTIANIEKVWQEVVPGEPFVYSFLSNNLDNLYQSEKASSQLLTVFALVAIVIACVGLFGLAAYMANQRTKEIGVRKVMGATVTSIVGLLSKDFARLVLISTVLGIPVALYLMNEWLQSFAYRVSLSAFTFIMAGLRVLIFTILTISYQAISAARINPVDSLKEE